MYQKVKLKAVTFIKIISYISY